MTFSSQDGDTIPHRLSEIGVVYTESRAALESAFLRGLSRSAEVRSSSPALILDPSVNVVRADGHISPESFQAFYSSMSQLARAIRGSLQSDPEFGVAASLIAQRILRLQTKVFKLMALREQDFYHPVAAITIETTSPITDAKLNAPYPQILSINPRFIDIQVPEISVPLASPIAPPHPSLGDRLRFSDWQIKAYRLASLFWSKFPVRSPFGTILILNEGDLVKETAIHLVKRGIGLRILKIPSPGTWTNTPNPKLRDNISPLLMDYLQNWLTPSAIVPTIDYLLSDIDQLIAEFQKSLISWRFQLDSLQALKPRAIFANNISGPIGAALGIVAGERSLSVVTFQHGVGIEIHDDDERAELFYETDSADILFTFNPEAARITRSTPLTSGAAISIGMPRDVHRPSRLKSTTNDAPPIWYISTMLYTGSYQMLAKGMGDFDLAKYESSLIDEVLALLPHRVLYKPYPANRYTDNDPVNGRAATCSNITLYEEAQDLRYLLPNSGVLVTSRPTSTLGWCLASGKPVVYIDAPGQPLRAEARTALADGLFLFEGTPSLRNKPLREFLSQPISDIEDQWAERTPSRRAMTKKFFDSGQGDAGAKAAQYLVRSEFRRDVLRKLI